MDSFKELDLSAPILEALTDVGYETPSPIQAACIPVLLAGQDILGEAQTGTGKTAAFALPLLSRLDPSAHSPQVLVLTPTRELAIQVAEAFMRYAKHLPGFNVLPVYGGQSMVVQLRQLKRGAHVIVGTPGRVMDHIERKSLDLSSLRALVLDEADEMLRMGFIDDVEWILEHTPATRQTALFSATMPDAIRRVAHRYLRDPQEIKIKTSTSTVERINQRFCQVHPAHKLEALTRILEIEEDFDAALVFVRTKTATVEIADKLEARGYSAAALNGDMTQQLRERVVEQLKRGSLDIVVATDVAARGLDVARITHVINYDIPYDTEAYVHRIGRTGRAGRSGTAVLFVTTREMRMLKVIERATRQKIEPQVMPSRKAVADRRVALFREQIEAVIQGEELDFFREVVTDLESSGEADLHEIAAALAFLAQRERPLQLPTNEGPDIANARPPRAERGSDDRFERPVRHAERGGDRPERGADRPERGADRPERGADRPERAPRENRTEILERRREYSEGKLTRYRIEVGRNHEVSPKDIVGAIANEAGIDSRYIGQINLYEDYSTVELPTDLSKEILGVLRKVRVKQQKLEIREVDADEASRDEARARTGRAPSGKPSSKPYGDRGGRDLSSKPSGPRRFGDAKSGDRFSGGRIDAPKPRSSGVDTERAGSRFSRKKPGEGR